MLEEMIKNRERIMQIKQESENYKDDTKLNKYLKLFIRLHSKEYDNFEIDINNLRNKIQQLPKNLNYPNSFIFDTGNYQRYPVTYYHKLYYKNIFDQSTKGKVTDKKYNNENDIISKSLYKLKIYPTNNNNIKYITGININKNINYGLNIKLI
jgi:hypothetical protein